MRGTRKLSGAFYAIAVALGSTAGGHAAAQTWTQLAPGGAPPAVRTLHTAILSTSGNRMVVFGGLNGPGSVTTHPMFNDVWVLSNADGSDAGAPAWTQLLPTGSAPSARGYHTAVHDAANNRMIVFAGDPNIGFCDGAANDVWVLANADGTGGTPSWTQLNPSGGPPEMRQGTRAVYDAASNRLIAFGGSTNACRPLNDREVWVLSNANGLGGSPAWTRLMPEGTSPAARAHHTQVYDPASNRLIVFGGSLSTGEANDVWVLENANGLGGTPRWTQLVPSGGPPARRSLAAAAYDAANNRMVVFGGAMPGGTRLNDVWVLQNANGLGGTPGWSLLAAAGAPSPRDAHTAVLHGTSNRLVVFAGRSCTSGCTGPDFVALNDTWMLTDANGITGTAPTLSYTPAPGTAIGLPGGALGAVVESGIDVQAIGGTGAGRVDLACSVASPFTLPAGGSRSFAVGAAPGSIAVGCTLGGVEASGALDCVETDMPGAATRMRSWPLVCPAGSAATIAADSALADRGSAVAIGVSVIGDGVVHSAVGDLVFDRALLTPTQVAPANGGSCFLRAPPNDDRIRINVPTGPAPLPEQQTTYCNVVFVVAQNAAIADIPLPVTAATCLDGSNTPVPCLAVDGAITVSAFDSVPRPGSALSLTALPGQSSVTASIVVGNFGSTPIDVVSCTPDPAPGYSVTPSGAFSLAAFALTQIGVGCTPPAAGLPPRVSDLSCLLRDTDPARVVRYRLLCSAASSLAPIPGSSIVGNGTGPGDEVGSALASTLAANGDEIMVVGAPFAGADDGGRAFVIVRPAGSSPIAASHKRSGPVALRDDLDLATAHALSATTAIGDKFGAAVAINAAGDTIAVGAPFGGAGGAGRVFVFRKPANGWTTLDTPALVIDAPQGAAAGDTVPDDFGAQVAFASGDVLTVGAPLSDVGTNAVDAGAAFAYAPDVDVPSAILRAPTVEPGANFAAAIAGNGDALAIGAPLANAGGNADQGAVYVMSSPGAPVEPTRMVTPDAGGVGDKFGSSVAFVGPTLVAGAPQDNTPSGADAGSATVFSGDAGGNFVEVMTLEPAGGAGQQAGAAVATNGDVILVGAPFATVAGRTAQGRVYSYDAPQGVVAAAPSATVIDGAAGQSGDRFGAYLAASPRRLLVGVPKDDNELGLGGTTVQVDEGRADPFLFDRVSRSGFE